MGVIHALPKPAESAAMADLDATAAARRAATARAVSFLSGSDSDDESLPSLSDEDVDPEELKRIAREVRCVSGDCR